MNMKREDIMKAVYDTLADDIGDSANLFEEDTSFCEDNTGPIEYGKRYFLGSVANCLIFLRREDEGLYVLYQAEREPTFAVIDSFFGGNKVITPTTYEFPMSVYDKAVELDFDDNVDQVYQHKSKLNL
jgi:hypothetical protein